MIMLTMINYDRVLVDFRGNHNVDRGSEEATQERKGLGNQDRLSGTRMARVEGEKENSRVHRLSSKAVGLCPPRHDSLARPPAQSGGVT